MECAECHSSAWTSFQRPHAHRLPQGAMSCNDCHQMPLGSSNEIFQCEPTELPQERTHLKVAPFHELWRKTQSTVDIVLKDPDTGDPIPDVRATTGSGISHGGLIPEFFSFTSDFGSC